MQGSPASSHATGVYHATTYAVEGVSGSVAQDVGKPALAIAQARLVTLKKDFDTWEATTLDCS